MLNEVSQTQVNSVFYISIESGNFYMEFGGGEAESFLCCPGKAVDPLQVLESWSNACNQAPRDSFHLCTTEPNKQDRQPLLFTSGGPHSSQQAQDIPVRYPLIVWGEQKK